MRLEYLELYAKKHDAGGIAGVFLIALFFFRSTSWRQVITDPSVRQSWIGIMVWINVIAISILAKPALITLKDYEKQKKTGGDPVFNPKALGKKNVDFWEREYTGDKENALKLI